MHPTLAKPELLVHSLDEVRFASHLSRWLNTVPLYRNRGDFRWPGIAQFQSLPQITKKDIRENFPYNFLSDGLNLQDLIDRELVELEHTSGTSEKRTPLILPLGWWAEQEKRALRLNSFVASLLDSTPNARRVSITSPVCNNDVCYTGVPSFADRIVGQTLFTSLSRQPFLWSDSDLARMARETVEWSPLFLDVDPVYGAVFARYCERNQIKIPSLRFILCSYEFVSLTHRRILERAFGVPALNLYGSTETGHLLMENDEGLMVPSTETAFFEVVEKDESSIGQLIVTTLSNDYMPLVRYRIGDLVEKHEGTQEFVLHGRAADVFRTPSGRRITSLQIDQCFAGLDGVMHYQLIQNPKGCLLRFIPDTTPPVSSDLEKLRSRLCVFMETPVEMQPADALMPETSGKFRLGYPYPLPA